MTSAIVSNLLMGWDGVLPVDPTRFAARNGISVKYDNSLAGRSGYFSPDQNTIFVNPTEPEYRQRFTVAHELGHCLLGHGQRDRKQGLIDSDPDETAANAFAAELLMPEDAVRQLVRGNTLQQLAYYFDVSSTAMYIRLKVLKLV